MDVVGENQLHYIVTALRIKKNRMQCLSRRRNGWLDYDRRAILYSLAFTFFRGWLPVTGGMAAWKKLICEILTHTSDGMHET